MSNSPPHWFVLGAGSIGCLYAAYLQRAGVATTLLLRDRTRLDQFRATGLSLRAGTEAQAVAIDALALEGTLPPIRQLLLCTKAQHSRVAIAAVQSALAPDALIVLLQNGMGVREELMSLLPRARFVHALSTEGAYQSPRFCVVHAGRGETLLGGDAAAEMVAAMLSRCGLHAQAVPDIQERLWQKLAINCAINPLTALHRCHNGELNRLPELAARVDSICAEIARVAAAQGMALQPAALAARVHAVIAGTAANRSSMLQDVEAGRETEIDYLNGYVVRQARRAGIEVPVNSRLLEAVQALR